MPGLIQRLERRLGRRQLTALLALFVVLFYATRLTLLLTCFPDFLHEEEPQRARLANDLLEGLVQPLLHYQFLGINGGSIPFSFVEAAFFFLFGNSYAALKLSAITAAAAGNALFLVFLRRIHGTGPALLAGLWLLFPPANVMANNVMEADNHNVYFFFAPLLWLLLARHIRRVYRDLPAHGLRPTAGDHLRPALLGLLGGLATYCYPAFFMVTLTVLAAWLAADRRLYRAPALALFAAAFAVAMIPQALFVSFAAGVNREFLLSGSFADRFGLAYIANNIARLVTRDAANAPGYFIHGWDASVPLIGFSFNAAMLALMAIYVGRHRRLLRTAAAGDPRRGLWMAMPGIVLMSFAGYALVIGDLDYVHMARGFARPLTEARGTSIAYRYFTMIIYCLIGMAAVVLHSVWSHRRPAVRHGARALYGGLVLLGALSFAWLVVPGSADGPDDGFRRPGIWYDIPRLNFYKWTGGDLARCLAIIHSVDERYHRQLYMGLGESIAAAERDLRRSVDIVEGLPERHRAALYAGVGSFVATDAGYKERFDLMRDSDYRARARAAIPPRYRAAFDDGFAEDSGAWSWRQRRVWDPRTRRKLWALYHRLKGPRYEPCYYRY